MSAGVDLFRPRLARRRFVGRVFQGLCLLAGLASAVILLVLLLHVAWGGGGLLSQSFLTRPPSQLQPETAGVRPALLGTLWLMALTLVFAVPVGVGAAVYLEEYSRRSRLIDLINLNIANLAGVPSIVYGILGLAVFVRWLLGSRSLLAGALTMSLLILPVIIIASRESLRAVPKSIREAAYAVGATRWQTVRHHVLPAGLPGILTGIILALSRAIGETAPLIMLGALTFVRFAPGEWGDQYSFTATGLGSWLRDALNSPFTTLPIQIYNWAGQPDDIFRRLAAAAIIVLLVILLSMNAVAVGIRAWQQRHKTW
jgi:phosphate transport system permease protein